MNTEIEKESEKKLEKFKWCICFQKWCPCIQTLGTWVAAIGAIVIGYYMIEYAKQNVDTTRMLLAISTRTNDRIDSLINETSFNTDINKQTSSNERIKLTSPDIEGDSISWSDLVMQEWLKKAKREAGANPHSHRYEILGKVEQPTSGAYILIDIKTNQLYKQGGAIPIDNDGSWKGDIWLDDALPEMILRITLREGDKKTIQEFKIQR